jgi:hypothetical protein
MNLNPRVLAARDQMDAAVRDRFDRHDVNLQLPHDRMTVLCMVGLIADAAGAFRGSAEDTPERRCQGIAYILESVVKLVEDAQ